MQKKMRCFNSIGRLARGERRQWLLFSAVFKEKKTPPGASFFPAPIWIGQDPKNYWDGKKSFRCIPLSSREYPLLSMHFSYFSSER